MTAMTTTSPGPRRALSWRWRLALRLLRLVVLIVAVAAAAFALMKISPVDPLEAYVGQAANRISPEQYDRIAARWGFDEPAGVQFAKWLRNVATGDLGTSSTFARPVAEVIAERVAASVVLLGVAWLLSGILGFALGVVAGTYPGSAVDRVIRFYAYLLASTPTFWLAILMLLFFSVWLGWTPFCCASPPGVRASEVTLLAWLHHLVLPTLALTLLGVAQITLHTRAKVVELMRSDFADYARAQGASEREIAWRHVARNAALPALTLQFASLGELFGGSVLAEQVFSYPGLGKATVEAGLRGDVPLLLAITILMTIVVSIGNTIADILYEHVDPRVREAGGGR